MKNIEYAAGRYNRTTLALNQTIYELIHLFSDERDQSICAVGNKMIDELRKVLFSRTYKLTPFDGDELIDQKNVMLRTEVLNIIHNYANFKSLKTHKSRLLTLLNIFLNFITAKDISHQYIKTKIYSNIISKASFFQDFSNPEKTPMVRYHSAVRRVANG